MVVAAQLVAPPTTGGPTSWLLPLPAIERAAAAVGHVNVSTESDGVARQILIRAADDQGRAIRAMAVESIRIGEGVAEQSLTQTIDMLGLTSRASELFLLQPAAEQRRLLKVMIENAAWKNGALHTTLFEPFQILRHSNRESLRKETENPGSGRDSEIWLLR